MNTQQFNTLQQALKLLNEADVLIQSAMGASDECFNLHMQIENTIEDVCDIIRTADEEGINA